MLQSENLGKVLLVEISVKTVVENFDSVQQFKIQLSKWEVIFFFTIFLFEKCLLGIETAHSYLINVNTNKMTDEKIHVRVACVCSVHVLHDSKLLPHSPVCSLEQLYLLLLYSDLR